MRYRGTSNSNMRGNSEDRRRRRAWLIDQHGIPRRYDGKKTRIPCFHCHRLMRADGDWEVDCHPICRHAGGRYVRGNIVPSCPDCNKKKCREKCGVC